MKIKLLSLFSLILLCLDATAQISFSMKNEDNKYFCFGEAKCIATVNNTYASAVLWAMDNEIKNMEKDTSPKYDFGNHIIKTYGCVSDNNNEYLYSFTLQMAVADGKISYLIDNISCMPQKGVFAAIKTVVFDKVNLKKKPKNQVFIDLFNELGNRYITKVINQILQKKVNIKHWDNIVSGRVVKGMTPDEAKLCKGKPINISENSQRVVWSYDSGAVVMFENGEVTGVVN